MTGALPVLLGSACISHYVALCDTTSTSSLHEVRNGLLLSIAQHHCCAALLQPAQHIFLWLQILCPAVVSRSTC
jgi:hypothetical protein